MTSYLLHVVAGLSSIASAEIEARISGARILETITGFDERTDLLRMQSNAPTADLLRLRTIEDVFVEAAAEEHIQVARSGLSMVRERIARNRRLPDALALALTVRGGQRKRHTFRVVARKAGEHAFRRVDLQRAVERGFLDRFPAWRLVEDGAQVEIWVHLVGGRMVAGIRLSDITMRNRTYRRVSLPAALKPTIAAAMVALSEPRADDVFLDPMCGSGTILIERALAGRYALVLGGDSDPEAVAATRENVGPRYQPIEIRQWDARALPLDDAGVSVIVCNLPFGKQIGSTQANRSLYPALLQEWTRVLRSDGRMVLLTSERTLLTQALQRHARLPIQQRISMLVRGQKATIFTIGGAPGKRQ